MKKDFWIFVTKVSIYAVCVLAIIVSVNYYVDAASMISARDHEAMARLALSGNVVAVPANYNERVFQLCIIDNMETIPDTIVLGNSRGMFVGKDVTGIDDIYNNCVSYAVMPDIYGIIGAYDRKFGTIPDNIIFEISPFLFFEGNTEARWTTNESYKNTVDDYYKKVMGKNITLGAAARKENPYLSMSYFNYNVLTLKNKGIEALSEVAKVSTNPDEAAEYPDGTTRYPAAEENESEERLQAVQSVSGAFTYDGVDKMTELDPKLVEDFEKLIEHLQNIGCSITFYLQPFSVTQCEYSIDQNLNPAFMLVENYIKDYAGTKGIDVVGGYDARDFGLTDNRFQDSMHLDKKGTDIVWNYKKGKSDENT